MRKRHIISLLFQNTARRQPSADQKQPDHARTLISDFLPHSYEKSMFLLKSPGPSSLCYSSPRGPTKTGYLRYSAKGPRITNKKVKDKKERKKETTLHVRPRKFETISGPFNPGQTRLRPWVLVIHRLLTAQKPLATSHSGLFTASESSLLHPPPPQVMAKEAK